MHVLTHEPDANKHMAEHLSRVYYTHPTQPQSNPIQCATRERSFKRRPAIVPETMQPSCKEVSALHNGTNALPTHPHTHARTHRRRGPGAAGMGQKTCFGWLMTACQQQHTSTLLEHLVAAVGAVDYAITFVLRFDALPPIPAVEFDAKASSRT